MRFPILKCLFIELFLAVPCLQFSAGFCRIAANRGYSLVVVLRLLHAVASLVAENGLRSMGVSSCGSRALERSLSGRGARGLSCSVARGIFPEQGSNPGLLHWQADS